MPTAHFGDVNDADLARATGMLAHYSRRTLDRPLATTGFNTVCEAAFADERLGELGLALCHAMEYLRPGWFSDDETSGWAALAAEPIPPGPPSTTNDAVLEAEHNLAAAFLAGFAVRDLPLVNRALELADRHQRLGQLLIALCQMFAAGDPHLFAPEAADQWADLAAHLTTRHGTPG
jgi:hypothetical protein